MDGLAVSSWHRFERGGGMSETSEILRKAKAVIENPENWTQMSYAADQFGNELCDPNSDDACRFCAVGAVARVLGIDGSLAEDHHAVKALDACTESGSVIGFNDACSHAALLRVWDEAIDRAEREVAA